MPLVYVEILHWGQVLPFPWNYYFSISLACFEWKRKNLYTYVYINGEIGGPNENTLEEDFNVIHYVMLEKPKYQLTSKHNETR